jgi:hypothetical protein
MVGLDGGDEPLDLIAPSLGRSILEAILDEKVFHWILPRGRAKRASQALAQARIAANNRCAAEPHRQTCL